MVDVKEANPNVVGDNQRPVLKELNKRAILTEDVQETVNEMKLGKGAGTPKAV